MTLLQQYKKQSEEFKKTFAEYANHERLRDPAFIDWTTSFLRTSLIETLEEVVREIEGRKSGTWCENCVKVKGRLRACGRCRRQRACNKALSDLSTHLLAEIAEIKKI